VLSTLALVLSAVELFAVDLGPIFTATFTIVQLWFLATGVWLLARGTQRFGY